MLEFPKKQLPLPYQEPNQSTNSIRHYVITYVEPYPKEITKEKRFQNLDRLLILKLPLISLFPNSLKKDA